MADQDDDRLSRPSPADGPASDSRAQTDAGSDGAAGRGLGGLGGDDSGSGLASLGGLGSQGGTPGAGGLDSTNLGGGGLGFGQGQGVARQNQAFGFGGEQSQSPNAGGLNEQQDELRAQAAAQTATDATDAQGLLDKSRAQTDLPGADRNNDSL